MNAGVVAIHSAWKVWFMFKKLFNLFKIGRKLSTSGAISSIYEIYNPPLLIKLFFSAIGFSINNEKKDINLPAGKSLCNALQSMGTTFIKLGQFLATRPDIIGEEVAKDLVKLGIDENKIVTNLFKINE